MKRLYNRPDRVVPELIEGLVALHPGLRRLDGEPVIVRADLDAWRASGRVALVSGGGSGHEPAHAGYVGPGMLTAAVLGDVFTSPSVDAILAAIRAVGTDAGILLIVKNYTGDRLNFGLAAEIARQDGIPARVVVVADDVAIAPDRAADGVGPRGLAGTILVHKVAGAAAEAGRSLADVAAEAEAAAAGVRTMGVALGPGTVPAVGMPGFVLGDDEVELGLGIHGEPGVRRAPLQAADATVATLLGAILDARSRVDPAPSDGRVALLVNGLGGTTPLELAVVARAAVLQIGAAGFTVERAYAGTFLSSLEMPGVSLSVLDLDDVRLARLDAPTDAPAWPNAAPHHRAEPPAPASSPSVEATGRQTNPIEPQTDAGQRLRAAIVRACEAVQADAGRLTELDRAVGDGDLGISLDRGARAVLGALPAWSVDDPRATLAGLAETLRRSLGGSSGPLLAVACLRAAGAFHAGSDPGAGAGWVDALGRAIAGIADLGGARPGDRTMLDALIPARDALEAALRADPEIRLTDLGRRAAEAAQIGAAATASLAPKRGRSSYLGDRALGHPDPGAEAVASIFRALAGG